MVFEVLLAEILERLALPGDMAALPLGILADELLVEALLLMADFMQISMRVRSGPVVARSAVRTRRHRFVQVLQLGVEVGQSILGLCVAHLRVDVADVLLHVLLVVQ